MQTVTYENGVVLVWDETLQIGELITSYHSGYHVLTGIHFRKNSTPTFDYVTVVREDGTPIKKPGAAKSCDAAYCRRVSKTDVEAIYQEEHNAAIRKREVLLGFA